MDRAESRAFERTLMQMGINPANIGKKTDTLPPLPPSDASSLQRNVYDGFYQIRAQEQWGQSEVSSTTPEDFKTCYHYLMKRNDEIYCTKCHIGWLLQSSDVTCQNGKLYRNDQELKFSV